MVYLRSQDDFEQFLWSVVFIAMGGIALGKGVTSSGLLDKMDVLIREVVDGLSLYSVVLVLSFIVLVRNSASPSFDPPANTHQLLHTGHLNLHLPHHRLRPPRPHRQSRRIQPPR